LGYLAHYFLNNILFRIFLQRVGLGGTLSFAVGGGDFEGAGEEAFYLLN